MSSQNSLAHNFYSRNTFIANYCAGTKAFVEEYWKIIHYAAGFVAFRNFLIVSAPHPLPVNTKHCDTDDFDSGSLHQ